MKTLIYIALLTLLTVSVKAQTATDSLLKIYDRCWELSPGVYRVMKNGAVGVAGSKGVLVPVEFQQVWNLADKSYFRVIKNGKTGLYHVSKGIIIPAEYDQISDFHQNMARVIKDGKIGYFGPSGEVVAPCQYQQIWDFNNGTARVLKEGKLGYINQNGQEIIPCIYQQIGTFSNGMARVVRDGKIGYVNQNGVEIIPCEYEQIWDFNNGRARMVKNGKIGYLDTNGKEVIPPVYSQIWEFEGDSAKAVLDGKIIYINNQGEITSSNYSTEELKSTETPAIPEVAAIAPVVPLNNSIITNVDTVRSIQLGKNRITIITDDNAKTYEFDNCEVKREKKSESNHKEFKGHLFGVDIGFNNYVTADHSTSLPTEDMYMELNASQSVATTVNFLEQGFNLNKSGTIGIVTGLGLEFNNYRFDSQYILTEDEAGDITYRLSDEKLDKNKLMTVYGILPLMLEFQTANRYNNGCAYLSAGVVGGVRLKSHVKVVDSEGNKSKYKGNYNLQDLRYGFMARVGYKFINLYGVYYPVSLFNNSNDPELYPFSIGFSIMPDWM